MIDFKNKEDMKLFSMLHPALIMIFTDMYNYAYEKHRVRLVVTQTITTKKQDDKLGRVSASHREHRAIDIRTRDIDVYLLHDIIDYINQKPEYEKYKYVSRSGHKRLAYYHIGTAEHIHLAIHSKFKL